MDGIVSVRADRPAESTRSIVASSSSPMAPHDAHELNGWGDDIVHAYLRAGEHSLFLDCGAGKIMCEDIGGRVAGLEPGQRSGLAQADAVAEALA